MKILCINAGSSSLKYKLFEMPEEKVIISGCIERIGFNDSFYTTVINGEKIKNSIILNNHQEAAKVLIDELLKYGIINSLDEIKGVGHRVLHGGEKYSDSVIITDDVIQDIRDLTKLGPLHHPGNLAGILSLKDVLPDTLMVSVYDTAFHQSIPKKNYLYPVPIDWYTKYGVRKYGFHGISYKYINMVMEEKLGRKNLNLIICHIGNGASICCVKNGKSYDTSMGLTPLDGLMMGTRSGSIDPSILEYVCKESGEDISSITHDLNKKSGLLGFTGFNDCRDIELSALEGNSDCRLALEIYDDRIAKYISEYYIELGGEVDAIIFTAGVGENSVVLRREIVKRLKPFGVTINDNTNDNIGFSHDNSEGVISGDDSKTLIYVIPTNEELMIVRDTYNLINK